MISKNWYVIGLVALLYGCIGTDEVQDTLIALEVLPPEDATFVNGSFAKLVGETAQLETQGSSDLGGTFLLEGASWQSDNPAVAMIDENGTLTALSAGSARIQASAFGVTSDAINVNVRDDATSVALVEITSPGDVSVIEPGTTLQLSARALTTSGTVVEGVTFAWESSNETIASVDQDGLVTSTSNEGDVDILVSGEGAEGVFQLRVGTQESLSRVAELEGLNGYRVSGDAVLSATVSGNLTLQLSEDFSAQNGPGLYLYLSNNRTNVSGGVEIGPLRSSSGADSYNVPSTVDLGDFDYVLVYCKPFGVGFGTGQFE